MKLSNRDKIFSAASLVVMAVTAFLLYQEFSMRIDRSGSDEIGTLTYRKKRAERRYSRQVIWEDLPQSAPVYNYDSIRTVEDSSARIHLKDGTLIDLEENTLIVLSVARKDIAIDFSEGSISASTALSDGRGGIVLKSGDTSMSLKGEASLDRRGKELDLSVSSGSAEVRAGGRRGTVRKNERASVSGKAVSVREIRIVPMEPANNSYYVAGGGWQRVSFKWKNGSGKPLVMEVAGDARFRKILFTKDAGTSFVRGFAEGTYYWRLKPAAGGEAGPVRKFTVISQSPPRLVDPAAGREISCYSRKPLVDFSWTGSGRATGYRVEISRSADFSRIDTAIPASGTSVGTDSLEAGRYWCRVRALYSYAGTSLVSSPSNFIIVKRKEARVPEARYPDSGASVSFLSLGSGGLVLNWDENQEISSYEVEISTDRNFRQVAVRERTPRNSYKVKKALPEGTWFWRVRGYDPAGKATPFSIASSVIVRGQSPLELRSPAEGDVIPWYRSGGSVEFRWRDPNRAGRYRISVASDARMKSLLREITVDRTSADVAGLAAGRLFYRVQAIDGNGKVLVQGPVTSFSISALLPEPEPVYPLGNSVVNVLNMNALAFSWNPVEGATHYRITLYSYSGSYSKKLYEKVVNEAGFTLKNFAVLDTDTFYWEVQALTMKGKTVMAESQVRKSYFAVTLGKYDKVRPITITSPGVVYTE